MSGGPCEVSRGRANANPHVASVMVRPCRATTSAPPPFCRRAIGRRGERLPSTGTRRTISVMYCGSDKVTRCCCSTAATANGEASLASAQKRTLSAAIGTRLRAQPPPADLHFVFAPLKHARLDYMVQKAVEMGASLLQPVITRHTQVTRINLDRMRANVIEAAEQCGILAVPRVADPLPLERWVPEPDRLLVFCDESADVADIGDPIAGWLPRGPAWARRSQY